MKKLIWYKQAIEDLQEVYNYYVQKSPQVAQRICDKIIADSLYLKDFTKMGIAEPFLSKKYPNLRALVTADGLYKILYHEKGENIYVIRLWNCRRDNNVNCQLI